MVGQTIAQKAERLSQRRARMLFALAAIYITQQAAYFTNSASAEFRTVDLVRVSAWLILSIVLLLGVATKGFWFHSKEIRDLIDDENTRANRSDAMRVGFLCAMSAAIVIFVATMYEQVNGREAVQIILSIGIGAALLRLAALERRAHNYG